MRTHQHVEAASAAKYQCACIIPINSGVEGAVGYGASSQAVPLPDVRRLKN
jgi:hypothetical protein